MAQKPQVLERMPNDAATLCTWAADNWHQQYRSVHSSNSLLLLRMSMLRRQAVLYLNRRERLLCLRFLLPLVLICLVLEDAAVEDPPHVLLAHHAVIGP